MQNNRKTILINKKFQLRFAFVVCSFLIPFSLIFPTIVYHLFNTLIDYITHDIGTQSLKTMEETQNQMIELLVVFETLIILITFFISLYLSHKIAGPLFKLKKAMDESDHRKEFTDLKFRDGDHFEDLANEYNEMTHGIKNFYNKNIKLAQQAAEQIKKTIPFVPQETKMELESAISTLNTLNSIPQK